MQRLPVASSSIAALGYHPERMLLEIEFFSGQIYQYLDVPPDHYTALLNSASKGRYFNSFIRSAHAHRRITQR